MKVQCENCIHKEVCMLKSDYKATIKEYGDLEEQIRIFKLKIECPNYERGDNLYRQTELLDKIKKARGKMAKLTTPPQYHDEDYYICGVDDCLEILDVLIAESEGKK